MKYVEKNSGLPKAIKGENDYWECERCQINTLTKDRMIPCPRGGCEAEVTGEIVTTVVLTKNK